MFLRVRCPRAPSRAARSLQNRWVPARPPEGGTCTRRNLAKLISYAERVRVLLAACGACTVKRAGRRTALDKHTQIDACHTGH